MYFDREEMTVKLEVLNPLKFDDWDELLLTSESYSFFHTSLWAKVLCESYKYRPLYFTAIDNRRLSALMPVMEINSLLTGRRGVSLPFTDYCQPIISDKFDSQAIIGGLIGYGKKAGWKYIEWRGDGGCFRSVTPYSFYFGHSLDLTRNEKEILFTFRDSTKRNIRKAIKEGVKANIFNSLESIKEFYKLNCMTRKHHGLPPQPYGFFKKVYDHIINKSLGFVVLASFQDKPVAGAVFFHFGRKAVYKYGASDMDYQDLRANNLVMWEAIKWYSQNEYKSFCFGRTDPENQGLIQFKSGWGTTEQQINYYRYDLEKDSFVSGSSKVSGFHNKIFRNIPIPLLNMIGSILYKHVG
jgi:hypothetical protein